jgi:hypothetical protein
MIKSLSRGERERQGETFPGATLLNIGFPTEAPLEQIQEVMNRSEEQRHLEQVLSARAQPTLRREATLGRLAEIYLQTPASTGYANKALKLVRNALETTGKGDPLYPKLRHLQAMALRWISDPEEGVDKARAKAAESDREAWQLSLETAPAEAILFANQWADWAWDRSLWAEAGEAYSNAHRALRRFSVRQLGDPEDRVDLQAGSNLATRGPSPRPSTWMSRPGKACLMAARSPLRSRVTAISNPPICWPSASKK